MRVLLVHCHPNPESLVTAAKDHTALTGLANAGHDVRFVDLYADGFEPAMTAHERRTHQEPGVVPELQHYADHLAWAEALVLVYPTWWSGQPAMLKGWFDRVWVAGIAWELPAGANLIRPLVANIRRIVVVTTHGSPKYLNTLEGESGKRVAFRAIRAMCSKRTRTTWCAIYGLDTADHAKRTAWLDRVERTLSKL